MEDENFNADDFEIVSGEPKVIFWKIVSLRKL